ncbi:MAG: formylglycine-generating enzyme family protein, partial [Deltaproteobacteria bacterium]|nr:formylglycine-generating enzyme family protein [Deltaproteobacteria bacterium]
MKMTGWLMGAAMFAAIALGCSSRSSSGGDAGMDSATDRVAVDLGADRKPADTGSDLAADAAVDLVPDVAADLLPDVPLPDAPDDTGTDTPTLPDTSPDTPTLPDTGTDTPALPDIGEDIAPDVCQPACVGMECGDDGCGGTCGTCPGLQDVCFEGGCICQPVCAVKECGDDGCGGTCGTCDEHFACEEGSCVYQPWCGDGACDADLTEDCTACPLDCPCGCGETCGEGGCAFTACEGKQCGSDGCGGTCGVCPGVQDACVEGTCVCQGACEDKECGTDGCGKSCGSCSLGTSCWEGQCYADPGLTWVPVPAGVFLMGCPPEGGEVWDAYTPQHPVGVAPFLLLETEVTEAQYESVTGVNPSCHWKGAGGPAYPVECVKRGQAKAFCEAVGGRLPTAAEMEYAARAGTQGWYACGSGYECLQDTAWVWPHSGNMKHPVKTKNANGFGLFDLMGNVEEWIEDCSHGSYAGAPGVAYPAWTDDCLPGGWDPGALPAAATYGCPYDAPGSYCGVWMQRAVFDSVGSYTESNLGIRCARSLPCEDEPCAPCVPSCAGDCGSDGCGGSCGECAPGGLCQKGACCYPVCNSQCGDDGCGGSCGSCGPLGLTCYQGDCVGLGCYPKEGEPMDNPPACKSCVVGLSPDCKYTWSQQCVNLCKDVCGGCGFLCGSGECDPFEDCSNCPEDCACATKSPGAVCDQGHCVYGDGATGCTSVWWWVKAWKNLKPGCGGCACEECVCQTLGLDYCCTKIWDYTCAHACLTQCGGCGMDGACGDGICGPDEDCTCAPDCPCPGGQLCSNGQCTEDTAGCTASWDSGCPWCACEQCVCQLNPYCCNGSWHEGCTWLCELACGGCGLTAPGCGDGACSQADGENCETCKEDCGCANWLGLTCKDGQCVVVPGCNVSGSPGCSGCACQACVCDQDNDPYCCIFHWDWDCMAQCQSECGVDCGLTLAGCGDGVCSQGTGEKCSNCHSDCGCLAGQVCWEGSCSDVAGCQESQDPGCGGCPCESCVCGNDPFCCAGGWDSQCILECQLLCGHDCGQ